MLKRYEKCGVGGMVGEKIGWCFGHFGTYSVLQPFEDGSINI
jgi:hypothetical protein